MNNNPYYTIWFSPTKTVKGVLSKKVKFKYHFPILVAAISNSFGNDIAKEFGFELTGSLIILTILTGFNYWIGAYFFPWWFKVTGKIWNGAAQFSQLQNVFGLAVIPIILIFAYQLLSLSIGEFVNEYQVNYSVRFVAWIFYARTLIIGIAKSQGFSYGIAIVNIVISSIPFIIIALMIK